MNYLTSAYTDIGIHKKTNQDSYSVKLAKLADNNTVAFAVICDGMGGLAKGEVASAHIIKKFSQWFENDFPEILKSKSYDDIKYQWNNIVQMENSSIADYGKEYGVSMGTTLTASLFIEDKLYIMHVGDTRLYEINESTIEVLTEDQTLVAREVRRGNMTAEQAKIDPRRNVLLQCIGASKIVEPQYLELDAKCNTTYMLCSDGFRHKISEKEIHQAFLPSVLMSKQTMMINSKQLIEIDKDRNETDNITVLLIRTY
ncbi:MAG: protein phosphatase 2C domain-containing protein [Clostridium sp.]|nr:protein phosphatase 2C domain-containing protein [Clostridium sp.]